MYREMADNTRKSTVRRHIDENLRRVYDATLNEPVPDKLTQLLEQLRQKVALPDVEEGNDDDVGGASEDRS